MKITIYHNPACSNSRRALELIREAGHTPTIVEYLKTPLDAAALKSLLARMDVRAGDVVRTHEPLYCGLALEGADEEALLAAIAANPILLGRPIVVADKGAKLCRSGDTVKDLL